MQSNQYSTKELKNRIQHMLDRLEHRGPNDSGSWQDVDAGVAFGHRRLSIVDLSSAGHQPMFSVSGRYVIVYNGEIYNFRALQMELEQAGIAPIWNGHSDTEVILAAKEAWGLEQAVSCFIGMFAFALWDRQKRMLHLVRDRLGIKPLYYGRSNGTFLFGSELKALKANPDFKAEIDRDALALFLLCRIQIKKSKLPSIGMHGRLRSRETEIPFKAPTMRPQKNLIACCEML